MCPQVSESAQDLLNRLLEPDPAKRMTLAECKAHPWFSEELPQNIEGEMHKEMKQRYESDLEPPPDDFQQILNSRPNLLPYAPSLPLLPRARVGTSPE